MIEESSPILNYYPLEFRTDLNGKKNDWEAVVLIPFIDEVSITGQRVRTRYSKDIEPATEIF